ncbi:MAG: RNA polymerase sigma factor [Candidatus Sulfotelmatobacter sp.]|jgi:RNA polymerase sigma-70 factor (ECF subfamily)
MIEGERLLAGEAILDEAVTVPSARESNQDALEDLARQHSRMVYRISYAALGSHDEAEDATQETFLRVLRYQHALAAVEDHKTWLARIAWRVAVKRSRQRGRAREIPLESPEQPVGEVPSADIPVDEAIHGSQIGVLLGRLLATLPDKLRQPLVLSAVEEMTPHSVAAILGTSEAAVRSRVFRARKILRERLAELVDQRKR